MSNLPINTSAPQPSGSSVNPAQPNTNNQEAGPFASLLARQIGESSPHTPATGRLANMVDSTAVPQKDTQDSNSLAAIPPTDPANALTAIMLQLPPEMRPQVAADAPVPTAGAQQTTLLDIASSKTMPGTDAVSAATANISPLTTRSAVNENLDTAAATVQRNEMTVAQLDRNNATAGKPAIPVSTADKPISALNLSPETNKHGELPANLIQTSHPDTQTNTPALLPGSAPNTLTGGRASDNSLIVNTPLGNKGWADDFSQQIVWMSTQKNQVAELHLNPPNLGPLDVLITITDKQATAQFSSPHGVVRDAVENALPRLREIFADNGIMLGNTTVSDQTTRERNAAGFMNQGSGSGMRGEHADDAAPSGILAPNSIPTTAVRRHLGIVDTFA